MGRFASTVAYYESARPPYGAAFFEAVALQMGLDGSEHLLDVGAGPGILAIGFAPFCREVLGVDPEPGMVEAARAAAERAGVTVKFIEARFVDSVAKLGAFDIVSIGRAIHWLDPEPARAALDRALAPRGSVLVCGATSAKGGRNPWLETFNAVRDRWKGDRPSRDHQTFFADGHFTRTRTVRVEATYAVGEYDIVILSAVDSGGLLTWLNENGYKVPQAAKAVVGSYLQQNMHFFLAKVNLERRGAMGYSFLRPIQIAYDSPKFMLPIRLGTINADGPQDMIVLALSPRGRIETTNYRTVKLPSGDEVPLYVKAAFGDFYRDMFQHQVAAENGRAVFLEYAWDMNWCDPCAADPLGADELAKLGAFWLGGSAPGAAGQNAFVTRLHVRYDKEHFPEDLVLQETADRENFQGRYVLRHPFAGAAKCEAGAEYTRQLPRAFAHQAETLARLTGWDLAKIRQRMSETGQVF